MTNDTIKQDTIALALPSGRRVGQSGHEKAIHFLKKRMREEGLVPFVGDDYSLKYCEQFVNLAGVAKGTDNSLNPILIGAHYDSAIDAPSADDNAVSVALILKIARHIKNHPLQRNTIIVFFDAEERPFFNTKNMGSIRFCNDYCTNLNLACVVILDAIGHDVSSGNKIIDLLYPRMKKFLFIQGTESHSQLSTLISSKLTTSKELKIMTLLNRYTGDHSDYLAFRKRGFPYLFICKGSGTHTHTENDTIDWVNFNRVECIYQLMINLINKIDKLEFNNHRRDKKFDPFAQDILSMKKAIGVLFPFILFLITGTFRLQSRKDIDALAEKLKQLYNKTNQRIKK